MEINFSKATSVAKFLLNRAGGVKYGGVKFGDGTFKLVKTDKLRKLNLRIDNRLGTDYAQSLDKERIDTIMRMTKPIKGGTQAVNPANIGYVNAHGYCQLFDKTAQKPVLDICEHLSSPIKTWWRLL